jgi:hypothetical protein
MSESTKVTTDLMAFQRARYDEDEREIRLVLQPDEPSPQLLSSHRAMHMVLMHQLETVWPTGGPRLFADIEAKRRILDLHSVVSFEDEDGHDIGRGCTECGYSAEYSDRGGWCETVRILGLPLADHPDYDESWRP